PSDRKALYQAVERKGAAIQREKLGDNQKHRARYQFHETWAGSKYYSRCAKSAPKPSAHKMHMVALTTL
ncbi:MAG: hypothetical protein KDJ45_16490, partial [Hyphomicrobiaceae bacterium]|nr:hypothetical protein [Hyphomicrobiaceae bacterium]